MSTPKLTSADFGSGIKFAAIQSHITPTALDYINRSERLKELIRAYEGDDNAENVIVDSAKARAATYTVPVIAKDGTTERGTATFGTETINTLHRLIETLSHELGHYAVENPAQIIANARAAATAAVRTAAAAGDAEARRVAANDYDAACHLTEGYARLATAKVIDEMIANGGLASSDGSWLLNEDSAYKEYKALQWVAAETSWTAAEMERAIAFSLGYSNRTNTTSTTDQSYLQYCLDRANEVYDLGATPPSGPAPATVLTDQLDASGTWSGRETTFDDAGNPVLVRWHRSDGSHGVESFNPVTSLAAASSSSPMAARHAIPTTAKEMSSPRITTRPEHR